MKIKKKGIAVAAVFGLASVGIVQVGAAAAEKDPVLVKKPGEVPQGAVEDATSAYLTPDRCDTTRSWTLTVPATEGTSHEEYQYLQNVPAAAELNHAEYKVARTEENRYSKVLPAVPAEYRYSKVLHHPETTHAEYRYARTVPEVSHQEYRWSVLKRSDEYRWSVLTRSDKYRWSVVQRKDQYRWSVLTRKLVPGTPETTKVIHHPAETKVIHHPAETKVVHHEAETHTEWKYVKHGGHGEVWLASNAYKYHWANGTDSNSKPPKHSGIDFYERTSKTTTVTDKEAWDETVTVKDAWDETVTIPGTPDTYTHWKWTEYTDWQDSTTPPPIADPNLTKYDSRYYRLGPWQWDHYTDWQLSATPPPIADPKHTKYGSRYHDYTGWTWDRYTHEWGEPWSSSTTPPPLEDPEYTRYDTRYHRYTGWKWDHYSEWSRDKSRPDADEYTGYGSRYSRTVVDEPAYVERTGWLRERPEGEGWSVTDERTVGNGDAYDETRYYTGKHRGTADVEEAAWVTYTPTGGWHRFGEAREGTGLPERTLYYTGKKGGSLDEADAAWVAYQPTGGWAPFGDSRWQEDPGPTYGEWYTGTGTSDVAKDAAWVREYPADAGWTVVEQRTVTDREAVPEHTIWYVLGGDPTTDPTAGSYLPAEQAPPDWTQSENALEVMDTAGTPAQVTHYAWTDGKQCDESDDPKADPEADPADDPSDGPSVTPVANTPEKSTPDVPTVIDAGL